VAGVWVVRPAYGWCGRCLGDTAVAHVAWPLYQCCRRPARLGAAARPALSGPVPPRLVRPGPALSSAALSRPCPAQL